MIFFQTNMQATILLVIAGFVAIILSVPLVDLPPNQQQALTELKNGVSEGLSEDYMKEDWYLLKFLRAKKFNVTEAHKMLLETANWRKNNKINEVLSEDFSEMKSLFPVLCGSYDKKQRPVLGVQVGNWKIRDSIREGKQKQMNRYTEYFQEKLARDILEKQKAVPEVQSAVFILDASGLNKEQHLCPTCAPMLLSLLSGMEDHYPGFVEEIIVINAPDDFNSVLQTAKKVMSEETMNAIKTFGTKKSEWEPYLAERIEKDQLYKAFGGSKKR